MENPGPPSEEEGPQCRICHGDASEGRLISPCVCKGSMKYVHSTCLETWRRASVNPRSYFSCENCKYKYSFRRTAIASFMRQFWVLPCLTALLFFLTCWLFGYVVKIFIYMFADAAEYYGEDSRFLAFDLNHFLHGAIGLGFVGIMSLCFGWANALNIRAFHFPGGGGGGGGGRSTIEAIIVGIFIFVGLCKVVWSLYGIVQVWSELMLSKAEDMVENIS
eukprot:TRINITY_DN2566_c0_g1_i2.p1 TRINITY_DN2566_c0_g1~~TRINITY_DN2566_c0_g1_i2.p1  ORF type:complete len:220 (+),score=3.68 TRINITY_DN2566_c0_g1_i2:256-915(+)